MVLLGKIPTLYKEMIKMKTVHEIVNEYNQRNEANITPLHGFKVGDKVKTAPGHDHQFDEKSSGEIIKVTGEVVIFEVGHKGSYDLKTMNEYWLMPNDSNNQTR